MLFPGGDKTRTLKKRRGHDRQRAKLILRQVRSRLASQLHLSIVRSPTPNSMPTNRPPRLLASPRRFVEYRENTPLISLRRTFRSSRITTIRFEEPHSNSSFFPSLFSSFPLYSAISLPVPTVLSFIEHHPRTRRRRTSTSS